MLIYSVIYLLLAIYIERINPGEFGVSQSWNYLFKRSYWKSQATSTVQPLNGDDKPVNQMNCINIEIWKISSGVRFVTKFL
jgi:ATP-binding cassette subfamily A (ABC1) protein 3